MSERDIRLYCADILDSGNAIIEFVKGMDYDEFCKDRKTYSAVIREAVDAFIEECQEMGTLDEVLEEAGFSRIDERWEPRKPVLEDHLSVSF